MSDDYRPEGFEDSDEPLPRDMPDQQAGANEAEEADTEEDVAAATGGGDQERPEEAPDSGEADAVTPASPGVSGPGTPEPEEPSG